LHGLEKQSTKVNEIKLSFSELHFKKTKLALAFIIATQGNIVLAQTPSQEPIYQDSELDSNEENANITWPLLSGESIESLASLFYPKNKKMQRLFISRTLQLSHEINPNLNAFVISNQASLIVIPNIKLLAKHSGKIKAASSKKISKHHPSELRMSFQLKDAAKFAPSPEMQAHYEDLVRRNALLKQELEKLNTKLERLQQVMVALNIEARRVADTPKPNSTSVPEPVATGKSNLKKLNVVKTNTAPLPTVTNKQATLLPPHFKVVVIVLQSILGIMLMISFFRSRKKKSTRSDDVDALQPMAIQVFPESKYLPDLIETLVNKVNPASTATEYTGNIADNNLGVVMTSGDKEDHKLVLEQAYSYVNSGREKEAIRLLKSQIHSAPLASLEHYLYLLDIYRATNQKDEFLLYASKFHQDFNVMTPQWENTPVAMVIASSLEEFPHIVDALIALWADSEEVASGTTKIKAYLNELLTDNRNSERVGFSMEVVQEIMLLNNLLEVRDMLQNEA
jgi:hypothetical protein